MQCALHVDPLFVTIGDIHQLHHVRSVLAIAVECFRDLRTNRGGVIWKRQQLALPPSSDEMRLDPFSLRLLPALIETFKGYEKSGHQLSNASRSSIVWRLRITDHFAPSTRTSAGMVRR